MFYLLIIFHRFNLLWVNPILMLTEVKVNTSVCMQGKQAVLMSVISGDAVTLVQDMEDQQVMEECMKVLRELFKEQVIFVN